MYHYYWQIRWVASYGKKIGEQLINLLNEVAERTDPPDSDYEYYQCVDNERVCQIGILHEEADYKKRYINGCCGFTDWKVEIDGIKYKLGFNYGH